MSPNKPPVNVVALLPVLDAMLIDLLRSLTAEDWGKQTVAKLWTVKDVVAHLLDGNIRILSVLRDGYNGERPEIHSYKDLVDFLNKLNADWVQAMKRVSPAMLLLLHELTGPMYCDYYASVDPFDKSVFAVNWAGEDESLNWMHIAREYTEKFLHQQQIRNAINNTALMTKEYFYPFINIFMYALPYTYREVVADNGTVIKLTISSDIGGSWLLLRNDDKWVLSNQPVEQPTTAIIIEPEISWKLFSKSIRPEEIRNMITINGDQQLGEVALSMISVMA
ncbi:MAG: hypothetical protein JWQ38_1681 [Flavipsychrobacter sp.]|nr:hypothetical protein [Flavipsychrobacter sp.]